MEKLIQQDYEDAAAELGCDLATIKAVCAVESNGGGFDKNGLPIILFEGHVFSRLTEGVYDKDYPTISYPKWTKQFYTKNAEHKRLDQAKELNEEAALKSASWGLFQIMGMNYERCGFDSVFDYVDAVSESEAEQLLAFINFVINDPKGKMQDDLVNKDWSSFARSYNGSGQVAYYAGELTKAYNRFNR